MLGVEHLLFVLTTFAFPPVALTCIILTTFGKGLGELYVDTLIRIFEWGACQIKSSEKTKIRRKESFEVARDETMGEIVMDLDNYSILDDSEDFEEPCTQNIIKKGAYKVDDNVQHLQEVAVKSRGWAAIRDSIDFVKSGIEAVIEDEVTSRFEAEQLLTWNMLTRTSIKFYRFVNWKLSALWIVGFLFRYCVMLPLRFAIFCIGLVFLVSSTALIGLVPVGAWKKQLNHKCMLICYRLLSSCLTAVVFFHDEHFKARSQGICVANHTSPVDALILSIDNVYALIGQKHDGLLGVIQRALSRASSHIWFDRTESKDRSIVAERLREHCEHPDKLPILIFPEGTCINNTSVMMFKKGCFEVETTIYPIAMKYDSRFGDAFWNSSEQSWFGYIMRMMTSWAIICHVWYLPPMRKEAGEEAVEFANRVKKEIAKKGGLVDLEWDGGLKRARVPPRLVERQQEKYANRLARYTSVSLDLDKPVSGYNSLEDLILTDLPEIEDCDDHLELEAPAVEV